jgi:beta-phosphoglucomutase-like phosphatase (HAD superfamily)
MIQAVIFDFNGVLIDDESVHFELFREVLAEEGVRITDRDYHEKYLGLDDRGCFEAALRDGGQESGQDRLDELIARKAKRYIAAAEKGLKYFPGAAEILGAVAAKWPVAINSGALRPEIEYALGRLNRSGQVAAIISAEIAVNCKPHPEGYLLALEALRAHLKSCNGGSPSLDAADCLVIEDSLAGIMSAKGAGMRAVGVATTYSPDQLREAGADDIVPDLLSFTPEWIVGRF